MHQAVALERAEGANPAVTTPEPRPVATSGVIDPTGGPETIPSAEEVGADLREVRSFAEDPESVAVEEYLHSASERSKKRRRVEKLAEQLEELRKQYDQALVRVGRWGANEYSRVDQQRLGDPLLSRDTDGIATRRVYVDAAVGRDVDIIDELRVLEHRHENLQESIEAARAELTRLDAVVREKKELALAAASPENRWADVDIAAEIVEGAIDYPRGTPDAVRIMVESAMSQLGVPWRFADSRPGIGFDCSGLTKWAWAQAGVELTHSSRAQRWETEWVREKDLRIGDLVFYGSPIHHVEIYLGNNWVIGAPNSGRNVRYTTIDAWGAKRSYGRVKLPENAPKLDASKAAPGR